jgi:hypothetical protein
MVATKVVVARKVSEHNGYQFLEWVWQTGPECFELVRHTLEPYGVFLRDLTLWEFTQWANECPEQVTLYPAH